MGTATESNEVSVARGRPAREPVSVRELRVSAETSAYQALSADDFR